MDQQRSATVKHIIRCFSCLPLSLTYVLSPSLINRLINDRQPPFRHCINSSIYRTEF